MRKLLGFLLLLVIIAGGGAYYYLTFVFPEREVVATLQQVADDLGAEFAYDDIEPGPLGLNGRITNARFAIPRVETGATFPSKKDEVAFDEISYNLDPVWMLKNIPTIYKLRAITHYKSLAFEGFESTESADE